MCDSDDEALRDSTFLLGEAGVDATDFEEKVEPHLKRLQRSPVERLKDYCETISLFCQALKKKKEEE